MPETMRAILKAEPAPGVSYGSVPAPRPGLGEVLVRIDAMSVCGTDVHIYEWDPWAQKRIHPPLIIGHEFSGTVVETGPAVMRLKVGDRVAAETHIADGTCYQCLTGNAHICENVTILGVDRDGSYAEFLALPESNAWRVAPSISPEVASVMEPLGNAVHTALEGDLVGRTVAVLGSGPIGCFAIGVARAAGAAHVFATDVNDFRLGLARAMGAEEAWNADREDVVARVLSATRGHGVDAVLEMSGHPRAIREAFQILTRGGRVALLGIPSRPVELDLAPDVIFKGAVIQGINGRRMYRTWYQTQALLDSGRLDIRPVLTHQMAFDEFPQAIALIKTGNTGKIVLRHR